MSSLSAARLYQLPLPLTGQAPQNFRSSDPCTSIAAGEAALCFASTDQALIYGVLKRFARPLAAEQISDELGWNDHVRVNRRLSELRDAGLIYAADAAYRNRRSGRAAQRWAVAQ